MTKKERDYKIDKSNREDDKDLAVENVISAARNIRHWHDLELPVKLLSNWLYIFDSQKADPVEGSNHFSGSYFESLLSITRNFVQEQENYRKAKSGQGMVVSADHVKKLKKALNKYDKKSR